jgi:hypothetical protein
MKSKNAVHQPSQRFNRRKTDFSLDYETEKEYRAAVAGARRLVVVVILAWCGVIGLFAALCKW